MSLATHAPPQISPDDDPLTATLANPATGEKLQRQAQVLLKQTAKPRPDVNDVVQDTLARALKIRNEYDPAKGTVGGWLYGILSFIVKENVRKTHGLPTQAPDDSGWWDHHVPSQDSPTDLGETRFLIERYLDKLAPAHRAIVKMRDFEDRDYADIAAQLKVTPVGARKLHSRAMLELKQLAQATKEDRS